MQKEYLYGIIGLLLGIGITVFVASTAVNNNNTGMMQMMGIRTNQKMMEERKEMMGQDKGKMGMGSSMEDMMESLKDKEGDNFDQAFISAMTIHHQGAIEMAKEAKTNAKHMEVKGMADDIISAQSKEIEMMQKWQKEWK